MGTEHGLRSTASIAASGTFVRHRFPPPCCRRLRDPGPAPGPRGPHLGRHLSRRAGAFDPERGTFTPSGTGRGDRGTVRAATRSGPSPGAGDGALVARHQPAASTASIPTRRRSPRTTPRPSRGTHRAGVRALLLDRQGNLWVGTLGGLHLLRRGEARLRPLPARRAQRADQPQPRHGGLAARGQPGPVLGGHARRRPEPLDPATRPLHGVSRPSRATSSTASRRTAGGALWLSTNQRPVPLRSRDRAASDNFDLTNGLQSLQFHSGGQPRTRDGRLLFGSVDGFYDFDPDGIQPDTFAPPVRLHLAARVQRAARRCPSALEPWTSHAVPPRQGLLPGVRRARLRASRGATSTPTAWKASATSGSRSAAKRDVTFTNLDPGRYVFRVKASNSDGVWSPSLAGLAARGRAVPRSGATWWFRALSGAVAAGPRARRVHRVRVRRLTRGARRAHAAPSGRCARRRRSTAASSRTPSRGSSSRRRTAASSPSTRRWRACSAMRPPRRCSRTSPTSSASSTSTRRRARDARPAGGAGCRPGFRVRAAPRATAARFWVSAQRAGGARRGRPRRLLRGHRQDISDRRKPARPRRRCARR